MTTIAAPLKNITLQALLPDVVRSCIIQQPSPPPDPGEEPPAPVVTEGIYTPIAPGVVYANLPVVTVVDTSPAQIIGCIITTADNPQGRLKALFPSAINGDGVIERSTNDIWVYNGTTWNNVGPTPGPTVVTATVIPPWNEISIFDATVRTRLLIESLAYGLTLLTQPDAYGVKLGITALNVTVLIEVPATPAIALAALPPSKAISVPNQNISLAAATPQYAIGIPVPSVSINIEAVEPAYAGLERTVVVVPGVDTSVQAYAPVLVLDVYMEIPLTSIVLAAPTLAESVQIGTAAPVLGRTGTVTFTDWTRIVNADTDDASVAFSGFGFTFTLNGIGHTGCFVGSNGYVTFGSGSSAYQNLSASVPGLSKLHFAAGDRSYQRVYTRTGRVRAGYKYASVRWEGSSGTTGTLGSPTVVTEITFYEQNLAGNQWIDVRYGVNDTTGLYMLASASTAYATDTSSADSSWVFEGNSAGTSWTLTSNRYIG